jgi:hypothetical protein
VNLENLTLSRLFYYQALRIVERAVLPTALVLLGFSLWNISTIKNITKLFIISGILIASVEVIYVHE